MTYQRFPIGNSSSNNITATTSSYSSKSQFYTETEAVEPSEEDIEEFARRIGIDPKTEPHLMHLAREGLMVKLPQDWKPCKDSHRDAWYYYNNQTHMSQWEHPMDAIYRDKVIQARSDHAMNRIQNFDITTQSRPLKTLPPLKKGGGGAGLNSFPSTLTKLGPLKKNQSFSSSEDLSQFSTNNNNSLQRTSLQPLEPLIKKSSGGRAPLNIPVSSASSSAKLSSDYNNGSSLQSNFQQQQQPEQDSLGGGRPRMRPIDAPPPPSAAAASSSSSLTSVKKSGLTLTGTGANFLKSAKASNSNTDLGKIEETTVQTIKEPVKEVAAVTMSNNNNKESILKSFPPPPSSSQMTTKRDLIKAASSEDDNSNLFQPQKPDDASTNPDGSLSDTHSSTGKPLKSILVNSSLNPRSRLDEKSPTTSTTTTSTKRNLWEIIPSQMTDEEHNQWEALDFASKRGKPSVKFQLDDPQLVFDISNRDSDEQDETEESGTEEEEDDESEEALEEESHSNNNNEDTRKNVSSSSDNLKNMDKLMSQSKPLSSGDCKFVVLTSENQDSQQQNFNHKPLNSISQRNHQTFSEGGNSSGSRLTSSHEETSLSMDKNDQVLDRKTIKLNMDVQLKEFQKKMEEEGKEQRAQIKLDMEKTIVQLKSEVESIIERTKGELEVKKKGEIDKARVEMETTMMADLEKIGKEYKGKLEAKKRELASVHESAVKNLSTENDEKMANVKNSVRLAEAGKEFERQLAAEITQLKTTLREQHEKQVAGMKTLHKDTIQKLMLEFQAEEEKLKQEHADLIVEMFAKFDTEKQMLLRSFEVEQDKIKQEFAGKAAKLTEELNDSLEGIKKQFEQKSKNIIISSTPTMNSGQKQGSNNNNNADSPVTVAGGGRSVELKQAEHELANLRLKYKSLEEKYHSLKRGVHNVVVNEKAKLDKNNTYNNDISSDHGMEEEEDEVESTMNPENNHHHHHHHHHPTNLEDLNNTNNTVDSGAAESDTSLSLSSMEGGNPVNNNNNNQNHKQLNEDEAHGKTITKMMTGSNDRLNQVLTALEDLKRQMLDIKSEQLKIATVDINDELIQDGHNNEEEDDNLEIIHHHHHRQGLSKKKKSSSTAATAAAVAAASAAVSKVSAIIPRHVSEVRVPRARVSRSALDSTVTSHRLLQSSKMVTNSANDILENHDDDNHKNPNGGGSRNYMDDFMKAKDFIKSEKYRLKRPGLSFGSPVSTSVGSRQRQDFKINSSNNTPTSHSHHHGHGEYNNYSETQTLSSSSHLRKKNNDAGKHQQQSLDHHSETESSGVGSWKEGKIEEKSKIGQDIEGILSSLQQLDGQMKYLWSVVGGSGHSSNRPAATTATTTVAPLMTSTLQVPQQNNNIGQLLYKSQTPMMMTIPGGDGNPQSQSQIGGGMTKSSSSPMSLSSSYNPTTNISDLAMKYNLSPNLITPGNQALINSINVVNSAQFRRSLDNPVLTTLEEHVNNIRNRQSRILQQYPTDSIKKDRSPSISEKTKDLREWLEKF